MDTVVTGAGVELVVGMVLKRKPPVGDVGATGGPLLGVEVDAKEKPPIFSGALLAGSGTSGGFDVTTVGAEVVAVVTMVGLETPKPKILLATRLGFELTVDDAEVSDAEVVFITNCDVLVIPAVELDVRRDWKPTGPLDVTAARVDVGAVVAAAVVEVTVAAIGATVIGGVASCGVAAFASLAVVALVTVTVVVGVLAAVSGVLLSSEKLPFPSELKKQTFFLSIHT